MSEHVKCWKPESDLGQSFFSPNWTLNGNLLQSLSASVFVQSFFAHQLSAAHHTQNNECHLLLKNVVISSLVLYKSQDSVRTEQQLGSYFPVRAMINNRIQRHVILDLDSELK